MKTKRLHDLLQKGILLGSIVVGSFNTFGQTNVFDDIIAPSPNHTYLEAAIVQEGLEGALQDNAANLTVFAPDDQAFTDLANALGTDINGLLALPNLADILTYHVLGSEVLSTGVTNGAIVQPLSATNTLKMTVTEAGNVYANQAEVTAFDIAADNGVVHVLDAVVLPSETAVDVAIDNGFTSLTAAVVEAELLPALTDPLADLTVFAPTDQAFDDLAMALGTDMNGVLAHPELADILLYHVVSGTVLSTDLSNGSVPTLNGQDIMVDLSMGVMINDANVTTADLAVDNGVVHVVDAVLVPSLLDIDESSEIKTKVFPNPTADYITVDFEGNSFSEIAISDMNGAIVKRIDVIYNSTTIDIRDLESGRYLLMLKGEGISTVQNLQVITGK